MKLYTANCRENSKNTLYPHEIEVRTPQDMARAATRDHMAAKMANNYRNTGNFLQCDCVMFDIDNTHSENPDAWKTEKDITEILPVDLYLVRSRNYMKLKKKTNKATGKTTFSQPREKWHVYCPLKKPITDRGEYEKLMLNIFCLFPFIDVAAIDCARFFYGVENPHVTFESGGECIDEYLKAWPAADLKREQQTAVDGFITAMQDGFYKADRAAQTVVNKACEFLGMGSPYNEAGTKQAATQTTTKGNAAEQEKALQWLERWAAKNGVDLTGKRYIFSQPGREHVIAICVSCPWEEEHSSDGAENEAVIQIDINGKLNFLCRHTHGASLNWNAYRAEMERRHDEVMTYDLHALDLPEALQSAEQPETTRAGKEDCLTKFFNEINSEKYKPYKTGLQWFDFLLSGGPIRQTVLLLLAAPAAGKTTLCQQIGECMAMNGKPVLYINLEMSQEQMIAKSLSGHATANGEPMTAADVLQGYKWTESQRQAVTEALEHYRENIRPYMRYNLENVGGNLTAIQKMLKEVGDEAKAAGKEAPVVVLDYLHLVAVDGARGDIQETIKQSVLMLKEYATNYDTFCIAISATNRESNKDGRITRDSGRDSSNIEYTGDYILSLNYYQLDNGTVKTKELDKIAVLEGRAWRQMIVRVLKNRFSVSGRSARVYFHAAGNRFYPEYDQFIPADVVAFDETDTELDNAGIITATADGDVSSILLDEVPKKFRGRRR